MLTDRKFTTRAYPADEASTQGKPMRINEKGVVETAKIAMREYGATDAGRFDLLALKRRAEDATIGEAR